MIKKISLITCVLFTGMLLLVGCSTDTKLTEEQVTSLCSDVLDSAVLNASPETIDSACLEALHLAGNPGGNYDTKELTVWSLYDSENDRYVCLCDVYCHFSSTTNVQNNLYRVIFQYDDMSHQVTSAEVINYERM